MVGGALKNWIRRQKSKSLSFLQLPWWQLLAVNIDTNDGVGSGGHSGIVIILVHAILCKYTWKTIIGKYDRQSKLDEDIIGQLTHKRIRKQNYLWVNDCTKVPPSQGVSAFSQIVFSFCLNGKSFFFNSKFPFSATGLSGLEIVWQPLSPTPAEHQPALSQVRKLFVQFTLMLR